MKGDMACGHNPYWKTVYDNCMACRAEQAEEKLALLTGKGGLVERMKVLVKKYIAEQERWSTDLNDALQLLTDLEALK